MILGRFRAAGKEEKLELMSPRPWSGIRMLDMVMSNRMSAYWPILLRLSLLSVAFLFLQTSSPNVAVTYRALEPLGPFFSASYSHASSKRRALPVGASRFLRALRISNGVLRP